MAGEDRHALDDGPVPRPDDLAPGDRRSARFDWSGFVLRRVQGPDDPDLTAAYEWLWREFGAEGALEPRAVLEERLAWDPRTPHDGAARLYEMLVVRRGDELVAVRDHTAVVLCDAGGRPRAAPTVVHLSHVVVEPAWRGSGLAAWLRTLPVEAARRCARASGAPAHQPVVLVAEMEHPDPAHDATLRRLGAYERAGFRKVDPQAAPYAQPDFRPAAELRDAEPRALPFALVLRRLGREADDRIDAAELAAVVDAIYHVYAPHVAPHALAPVAADARRWLGAHASFRLLPPTAKEPSP